MRLPVYKTNTGRRENHCVPDIEAVPPMKSRKNTAIKPEGKRRGVFEIAPDIRWKRNCRVGQVPALRLKTPMKRARKDNDRFVPHRDKLTRKIVMKNFRTRALRQKCWGENRDFHAISL